MSKKNATERKGGAAVGCTDGVDDVIDLVFDIKLRRPACVFLQSVYGCGHNNGFLQRNFDSHDWLVAPTPDMRKIRGTREQWQRLAAKSSDAGTQRPRPL